MEVELWPHRTWVPSLRAYSVLAACCCSPFRVGTVEKRRALKLVCPGTGTGESPRWGSSTLKGTLTTRPSFRSNSNAVLGSTCDQDGDGKASEHLALQV